MRYSGGLSASDHLSTTGVAETQRATHEGAPTLSTPASQEPGQELGQELGEVPVSIGRFRVVRQLGAGGMGVVYLAHDPELERDVAVKVLHPKRLLDAAGPRRLLREAQAMARLQHPNVVTVYEVGVVESSVWVAMEPIHGVTLRVWAGARRRVWSEALDVMLAAGRGLEAAHRAGLVHRDIKPDNIMIGDDGRVRVMDFGLVREEPGEAGAAPALVEPALSRTGALVGTPLYMAAEQFLLRPTDARSDQFAWCATCWEIVYGQRPFAGTTVTALGEAIIGGKIVPPPATHPAPAWLRGILERGLSPEPARRFADMRELFAAINEHRPTFESSLASKNAAALRAEAILGMGLIPMFWILDWLVLPQWVWWTLGLRLSCVAAAAVILALSLYSRQFVQRHVNALAFAFSALVAWSIAVMCFLHEGYESPYYAGINLLYLAVGQFFSWELRTALAFFAAVYGFYMLPLVLGMLPIHDAALVLSNQFFLISTIVVSIVSQVHRLALMRREFEERRIQDELLAEARAQAAERG